MQRGLLLIFCFLIPSVSLAVGNVASNMADTFHNLSVSGQGQFKSATEDRICVFCHTPHTSSPDIPMWNRRSSSGHITYQSSTSDAVPGVLDASSRQCLSCHDGTIALGDVVSNNRAGQRRRSNDLAGRFLGGRANLGTDLSDDHPVSIVYDVSLQASDPDLVNPVNVDLPLNRNSEMHCVSCHDPHNNSIPPFLHKSTLNGELCVTCHLQSGRNWEWVSSSHALSKAKSQGADPWSERKPEWKGRDVSENACMNCHTSHNATIPARLMTGQEEKVCYRCHTGMVAGSNIRMEQQKFFRHPVEQTPSSGHDNASSENPLSMAFHVECEDCHNPHASQSDSPMISFNPANPMDSNHTMAPFVNGSLLGVSGIDVNGSIKSEADYEYEVCFKCHGVPGKNACDYNRCSTANGYDMARQDGTYNLRDKLSPGNPTLVSYHPVVANDPNNNTEVPSLRRDIPLNKTSGLIYCNDCHSSDNSPAAGGAGSAGPHGSRNEGIMALPYRFDPESRFNSTSGGLCLKCHDSASLYANESFPHRQHVLDQGASCINCHDPHGSAAFPHLLNFLTTANVSGRTLTITGASTFSEPTWEDNGRYSGTCYLNCHGYVHDGTDATKSRY